MDKLERIYRRTDSGLKAWVTHDPEVSNEHRRILGLIHGDVHGDVIRTLLRRHADYLRLADLEAQGMIVSSS
jgi:hypothetical protein